MSTAGHCPDSPLSFTAKVFQRLVCFLTSLTPSQPPKTCSCFPALLPLPIVTGARSPPQLWRGPFPGLVFLNSPLPYPPGFPLASMVVPLLMLFCLFSSLYRLSPASATHFLASVTTCRPMAPKPLSLAKPSPQIHSVPQEPGVSPETQLLLN